MNKYEMIFIIKKCTTEEELRETVSKIEDSILKNGKITKTQDLGIKDLIYKINRQKQGHYFSIEFECNLETRNKLGQTFETMDEILKSVIMKKN